MTSPEVGAETDVQAYSLLLNGHADKQPRNNIKAIRLSCICCFLQRTYWSESRPAYQFPQENGQCDDKKNGDALHDGPCPGRKTEFCNFDEAVKQEPEGKCASIYLQCKLSHYSAFIDVTNKNSVISERCSRQN